MKRAVFLDRDGVLNPLVFRDGRLRAPLELDAFRPYDWAATAVAGLKRVGLLSLVVTNQPEIATGELAHPTLDQMHERLRREVAVDGIYVCPHQDSDRCVCRKPRIGLIREAATDWSVELTRSFVVGDGWRDMAAGREAGCVTILVATSKASEVEADHVVEDLRAAVGTILRLTQPG